MNIAMYEIVRVALENEMDLMLAHKQTMKLAELIGFSLVSQTTFATAISEISRQALAYSKKASLTLNMTEDQKGHWCLLARLDDHIMYPADQLETSLNNARRLVSEASVDQTAEGIEIKLCLVVPFVTVINAERIDQWRQQFRSQASLSPYDELKRKNYQLQALAERLTESESNYQVLTDSLHLMIFTASKTGELRYTNDWLTSFTGETVQQLNDTQWKTVVHETDWASTWPVWSELTRAGKPFEYEFRIRQAQTGAYNWHLLVATPALNADQQAEYWTGFVVDIQAQKLIAQTLKDNEALREAKQQLEASQQELERANLELKRSNENLQQFAYIASHDLQEPLRKVQAFGDVLRQQHGPTLGHTGIDLIERMEAAASRMSGLIKDLLTYSRISTHQAPFQPVKLNQVVEEVLMDLSVLVQETGAVIDVGDLPQLPGDNRQLRQLFQNLLSNALRYINPETPPVIQVASRLRSVADIPVLVLPMLSPSHKVKSYYEITVTDNGIGFDEKYLDRIFQVFQRLHGKSKYPGTGVGLAICRKVAENHEGAITASSQPGLGATFAVYLPA